jgi:hypothetical protein
LSAFYRRIIKLNRIDWAKYKKPSLISDKHGMSGTEFDSESTFLPFLKIDLQAGN